MKLRIGISPCPNDTFVFHGLLADGSDRHGLDLEIELLDIQELNERLVRGEPGDRGGLDAGKASFAQALSLSRDWGVLPVGSAIGYRVGPLLVSRRERPLPDSRSLVLCPGAGTTAYLLLRMLLPQASRVEHVRFDKVMPAVANGKADFGVVIHEGRFTYREHGLAQVVDLGALWETRMKSPVPLGGLLARRSLGDDVHRRLTAAVRASLDEARSHREAALATMQRHAQELAPEAIWQHVELYVNELTRDLGREGADALAAFERAARESGLVPEGPPLEVLAR